MNFYNVFNFKKSCPLFFKNHALFLTILKSKNRKSIAFVRDKVLPQSKCKLHFCFGCGRGGGMAGSMTFTGGGPVQWLVVRLLPHFLIFLFLINN